MPAQYHIIVVDDHALYREALVEVVRRCYTDAVISEAGDGEEALRIYRLRGANLVITDYHMARVDGGELVRRLRAWQADLPILLISGDSAVAEQSIRAGASAFLEKPFREKCLARLLIGLLPCRYGEC